MRRLFLVPIISAVIVLATASAAFACGSLIGPNGAVHLVRTSTLAAWHDGVEHYVTNFEFASNQTSFGSIIPLPAEPTTVERGGDWTLQRLTHEVAPLRRVLAGDVAEAAPGTNSVDVLQQTRIDSLDVTILRGGGTAVADWAAQQGFDLTSDTPDVLEFYSHRSQYFMAAKFDATAAVAQGLNSGDGIPVHLTIPVERPWVPLRILGTGQAGERARTRRRVPPHRRRALAAGGTGAASRAVGARLRLAPRRPPRRPRHGVGPTRHVAHLPARPTSTWVT